MCSIEEAWAGQTFDGKNVISQGDMHNAYMSLPDNVLTRDNEFSISKTNSKQARTLPRGINSKYSREPRIPKALHSTNNADINISSELQPINNYGGLEPLPSYMQIYKNSNSNRNSNSNSNRNTVHESINPQPQMTNSNTIPMPVTTGEKFTDINTAYDVSNTLNNFMNTNTNNMNNNKIDDDEYTEEETRIINTKFNNINKYNNSDTDKFVNIYPNNNVDNYELKQIYEMLNEILNKINKMEGNLHSNRNIYDIVLYVIIGMLLSFIIYSILSGIRK